MRKRQARTGVAVGLAGLVLLTGCGGDDGGSAATATTEPVIDPGDGGQYAPDVDPADFVDGIDNPWLPLRPGSRWVYEGTDDGEVERVEVVVTDDRREILGISAVVVRDTVTVDGELAEDTFDWFAQDADGNVWYLGEDSKEYEDGEATSSAGSWEAGVGGAEPGIVMPADPSPGEAYRQEFLRGEAEDLAEVVAFDGAASVGSEQLGGLLVIREWNPLEPETVEEKLYARGTGLVLERKTAGGRGTVQLVEHTDGS